MLITVEGGEGSGKSSLCEALSVELRARGRQVVQTREPGGTECGRAIRRIVLDSASAIDPMTEVLLFAADRAQHVREVIRPSLDAGEVVVCDRFVHSTLAYQGYGRGVDMAVLEQLNAVATGGLLPDMVIFLDVPAEVGLERAQRRDGSTWNRFEEAGLAFQNRVRDGFRTLAGRDPERFRRIDAARPFPQVLDAVLSDISAFMEPERE